MGQFIMFVLGSVLTAFVVVIKIIQIMRYGFSMLFNVKVEWAFKIEFWPLQLAVNLDMLQLFCFLFFTYGLFFSAIVNYSSTWLTTKLGWSRLAGLERKCRRLRAECCLALHEGWMYSRSQP